MKKPYFLSLVSALTFLSAATAVIASKSAEAAGLLSTPVVTIDGQKTTLEPYSSKVILVVNTASQCGYTPQYGGLQKLYARYKDRGLVVLGFPSNDFGGQEPGTNSQIKLFCKGNYKVDFPMFEKGSVTGKSIQPLFANLISASTQQLKDDSAVGWNFEKFLISREGVLIGRFRSRVSPDSQELTAAIERALAVPSSTRTAAHRDNL